MSQHGHYTMICGACRNMSGKCFFLPLKVSNFHLKYDFLTTGGPPFTFPQNIDILHRVPLTRGGGGALKLTRKGIFIMQLLVGRCKCFGHSSSSVCSWCRSWKLHLCWFSLSRMTSLLNIYLLKLLLVQKREQRHIF